MKLFLIKPGIKLHFPHFNHIFTVRKKTSSTSFISFCNCDGVMPMKNKNYYNRVLLSMMTILSN